MFLKGCSLKRLFMFSPFREIDAVTREVLVKVAPRASKNEVSGIGTTVIGTEERSFIKVFVTTPPEQGKANEAVIRLFSKTWRVPKSKVRLTTGATAHLKVFRLTPLNKAEIAELEAWFSRR